jgi:hypothetical protein
VALAIEVARDGSVAEPMGSADRNAAQLAGRRRGSAAAHPSVWCSSSAHAKHASGCGGANSARSVLISAVGRFLHFRSSSNSLAPTGAGYGVNAAA